jgi:hypothetical protein
MVLALYSYRLNSPMLVNAWVSDCEMVHPSVMFILGFAISFLAYLILVEIPGQKPGLQKLDAAEQFRLRKLPVGIERV